MTELDSKLLAFKYICNFVKDLNDSFGTRQKSLFLYAHLIERTGIMHEEPIKKHIGIFYNFIKKNEEGIIEKNIEKFTEFNINYSEKVWINLKEIFDWSDTEEKEAIFKHCLALSAVLNPSSCAKNVLKKEIENKKKVGEQGNEEQFLRKLIDKVTDEVDQETDNPMQVMSKMMNSGVFKDIVEDMNTSLSSGELDMSKMVNTMQMIMGSLGNVLQKPCPSLD